jgi:TolA-binding protein
MREARMRLLPIWTLAIRALALAGLLLTAWPAAAQMTRDEIALRDQVYELQQQVQALQQQVATQRGGGGSYLGRPGYQAPPGGDIVAQLLARVQTLEEEVRTLHGRVDEAQNELQKQGADLGKRIDDLAFQMQNPGATGGAPTEAAPPAGPDSGAGAPAGSPSGSPQGPAPGSPVPLQPGPMLSPPPAALGSTRQPPAQPAPPPAAPAPPARRTPELDIQDGNMALARHDYAAAEAAARDVLNNHRTSPRAYDAQFLLARALAGERQFSQAAIAYDDTYNRNRKGARAPDALVGLANALTAINEKRAACDTLAKLHTEFPQQRPDVREAAASVQQRAACR